MKAIIEDNYYETRAPQVKNIPYNLGQHLHSTIAVGYVCVSFLGLVVLRYRGILRLK